MLSSRLLFRTLDGIRNGIKLLASPTLKNTSALKKAYAVASVSKDHDSLLVTWDKQKDVWSRYHYEWLRDNCACSSCRHPETGQRVLTTLEDYRPDIIQGDFDNEQVKIKWNDGHNSQFQHRWLLENSYYHSGNIASVKPATKGVDIDIVLWDAEYFKNTEPPSVGYEEFMKSDGGLLKMLQQFRKYGLCFIHNTPASKEATSDAIKRIGRLKNSYYGGVWNIIAGSMSVRLVFAFLSCGICITALKPAQVIFGLT